MLECRMYGQLATWSEREGFSARPNASSRRDLSETYIYSTLRSRAGGMSWKKSKRPKEEPTKFEKVIFWGIEILGAVAGVWISIVATAGIVLLALIVACINGVD